MTYTFNDSRKAMVHEKNLKELPHKQLSTSGFYARQTTASHQLAGLLGMFHQHQSQ